MWPFSPKGLDHPETVGDASVRLARQRTQIRSAEDLGVYLFEQVLRKNVEQLLRGQQTPTYLYNNKKSASTSHDCNVRRAHTAAALS
jgi:hypothetical protein